MLQVDSVLLVVGANLLGLLIVLLSIVIITAVRRTLDARVAVRALADKIRSGESEHDQQLRALLTEKYGYSDGEVAEAAAALVGSEKRFYEQLIALFIQRNSKELANLDEPLETLLSAYRGLVPRSHNAVAQADPSGASAPGDEAAEAELQRLKAAREDLSMELQQAKEANERMSTELGVTLNTMSSVLSEYSVLYEGREEAVQQLAQLTPERLMKMLRGDFDLNELAADTPEQEADVSGADQEAHPRLGEGAGATTSPELAPDAEAATDSAMPDALAGVNEATLAEGPEDESLDEMLADTLSPETILPDEFYSSETGQTSGNLDDLEQLLADSLGVEDDELGELDAGAPSSPPSGEDAQSDGDEPERSAKTAK